MTKKASSLGFFVEFETSPDPSEGGEGLPGCFATD